MTGIVSERDYICKIALLGRTSKETPVKEIATAGANIITAKAAETVEVCMEKMMQKGIRHLPIVDDSDNVVGMVSIKDLVKTVVQEKEDTIKVLSDFALGKGGHFGSVCGSLLPACLRMGESCANRTEYFLITGISGKRNTQVVLGLAKENSLNYEPELFVKNIFEAHNDNHRIALYLE